MSKRKIPRRKPRLRANWFELILTIIDTLLTYGPEAYKLTKKAINKIRKTLEENKKKTIKKRKTVKKRKTTTKKKTAKKKKTTKTKA